MATVSSGDVLNLWFSADEQRDLNLLQYELSKAEITARFVTGPGEPGRKGAGDLVPFLVVAAATLAEARKIISVLVDARVRLAKKVRVKAGEIEVTNADSAHIEKIIEGHFGADRELPGD